MMRNEIDNDEDDEDEGKGKKGGKPAKGKIGQ
jgi:hypothetical protein